MYNPIHEKLLQISDVAHIDEVTLKLALCLFSSFPLNAVLKRLPDKKVRLKCLYIISISAFYLFGILNLYQGFRTLFISTLFTYVITRFYRSKFMPYVNFVFVMAHLALNHMYEQFFNNYDSGKVDITGAQMVLVMKLTSFAWSYYDGTYADKNSLSSYQKHRSIEKHPSLLQFFAYAFFYPSLLTGPSFDYADFETWLNCEIFRDLPESKKPKRRWSRTKGSRRQIPKCGWYALSRVLQGVMWIVLSLVSVKYVNIQYALSTAFRGRSFFYKIHYLYFLGLTFRFKYYAAWIISEASCMVCGLGYNGYDAATQSISWNRVQNIDIWSFEFAQNTRETLEAWNMNTNKWLKYYVYLRTVPKGKKPGFRSTLFTFLTSAFWHGTRPGYYLSFATGALFQTVGKIYRRNFRPMFLAADGKTPLRSKIIYDIVCFWVTKLAFGYLVQPFVILDWSNSLYCWGSVYFYIHMGIAATFILFIGPMGNRTTDFLKRFHAAENIAAKSAPTQGQEQTTVSNLDAILAEKRRYEQADDEEHDMMLGIPDPMEVEIDEAKRDLEVFRKQYESWKQEKGLEIEEGNLRHAFLNFKKEFKDTTRRMSFSQYSSAPPKSD